MLVARILPGIEFPYFIYTYVQTLLELSVRKCFMALRMLSGRAVWLLQKYHLIDVLISKFLTTLRFCWIA